MRLIMKCKDTVANIKVDEVERRGDVIFAYKSVPVDNEKLLAKTEFVGMFDLGSMDFLYVTEEKI